MSSKFVNMETNENALIYCNDNSNFKFNKKLSILYDILQKCLDYEQEILTFEEINHAIDLFQKIPNYQYRSPIYFTLAFLVKNGLDWDTLWNVLGWFENWIGNPLNPAFVVLYYRYIVKNLD